MSTAKVFFVLMIVCLIGDSAYANDPKTTTAMPDEYESGIDEFLRLFARPWKKTPLKDLVKNKEGRSKVRKFVAEVRLKYQMALAECGNDPVYLNEILRRRWDERTSEEFRLRGYSDTTEAEKVRRTYTSLLPNDLQYSNYRTFEHDPYLDDSLIFEQLFNFRVSWRSFDLEDDLLQVFNRYKELWMQRYSESNTLLSEVIYLWLEASLERVVSLVTEWEIYGITTDELDNHEGQFPSHVVPPYVADMLENDHHYQWRIYQHDLAKTSRLFYGLPVGTRLPSNVPKEKVNFTDARKNLAEAATKLSSYHGDEGMRDLGTVANQYLRAIQEASNKNENQSSNEICSADAPSCSKWESDEARKIMQCASIEIHATDTEGRISRIDRFHSPSRDSGIVSGGSTRSSSRSSPRRFNLDLNRIQSGTDLFPENNGRDIDSLEQPSTSTLTTRYALEELLDDCMDLPDHNRQKRDLHLSPVALKYKRNSECKKKINQVIRNCTKTIYKRVEDPRSLVGIGEDKYVLNLDNFTVSCGEKVIRVTNATVWLPNFFESVFKTIGLFGVPVFFFAGNRDDMGVKSLEVLKKNCDSKNKCSVPVNIEKSSDHTSVYNLELKVGYECAPRGCNPDLYPDIPYTVNQDEAMILQCVKDDEGIYFTSAHWEKKSGFGNWVSNIFTSGLPEDSDGKSLEFLKRHCSGRFRCDTMAVLKVLTGQDSGVQATFTVNYKCLPCKVFLWKNYNYNK